MKELEIEGIKFLLKLVDRENIKISLPEGNFRMEAATKRKCFVGHNEDKDLEIEAMIFLLILLAR